MNHILLIRTNPEKKMRRWYSVSVQPTLFDQYSVVCMWGSRKTAYQRQRIFPVENYTEALQMASKIVQKKEKRGYTRL